MTKKLSRISLQLEEDPLAYHTSPNVIAVLPSSSSHGSFVAVATHSAAPVTTASSLTRPKTSGGEPVVSLAVYTMGISSPSVANTSSSDKTQAPDMMLLHTVSLSSEDLGSTLSHHSAGVQTRSSNNGKGKSMTLASGAPEPGNIAREVWTGKNFFSPQSTETLLPKKTSLPEVERIEWVSLGFLAVKTRRRRQLLLVRSGLSESVSPSDSEEEEEVENTQLAAFGEMHGDRHYPSAVCASFLRIADFCCASIVGVNGNTEKSPSPVSVMIVAEERHVTSVVCCHANSMALSSTQKARSPESGLTKQQSFMKKHTWNIGPFNRVAATALPNSEVCICGTSPKGSVEVYVWAVKDGSDESLPLCVHQVLLGREHFFYGIAVAAAVASPDISLWVMGGQSAVTQDVHTALEIDTDSKHLTLPVLRGLDGRVLQVLPQTSSSCEHECSSAPQAPTTFPNVAPRVLNSAWKAPLHRSPQTTGEVAKLPDRSSTAHQVLLDSSSSLRIVGPPHFLLPDNNAVLQDGVDPTGATLDGVLTKRYILLVDLSVTRATDSEEDSRCTSRLSPDVANEQKYVCRSSILSLDSEEGAAALGWLAGTASEGCTTPIFSVAHAPPTPMSDKAHQENIATVLKDVHDLILSTPHRVLQLRVSHWRDPADYSIKQLGLKVYGIHEIAGPQRIVGISPLVSHKTTVQLLLVYGLASRRTENSDCNRNDDRAVYGQWTRKSTWIVVENVQASILHQLAPWDSPVTTGMTPQGRNDEKAQYPRESELLEKIHAIVQTEGARIQCHLDDRMDRLEAMLKQFLHPRQGRDVNW